ncbi:MAG: hypothetical protein ABEH40_09815 [Haloferacaceae archaeon]
MARSRREVLGVVGSGLLAGCAGVSVPSLPSIPNPLGGGDGSGSGDGAATTPRATEVPSATPSATATPAATPTPAPRPPGEATARVFDEVAWFAAEYGPATSAFRSLAARMRNLADGLSRRSSITEANVATLRGLADRIAAVVEDRLGPHFDTSPSVVGDTRRLVDRIATLRERRDWDGVSSALAELAERHATFATESYVARAFPRDPVRGPLVRYAAAPGRAGDAVVMAYHVGADAFVRAQETPGTYPGTPPGGRGDVRRYRTLFGPLAAGPDGRAPGDAGAYLTVTGLSGGATTPLSVRRYRDAAAATAAVEELLAGGVTAEGTARRGGREWQQVFYRPAGDVLYADLTLAGPFLVAAGPSPRPWDDRDSAGPLGALRLTWLWEEEGA